MGDTCYHDVRLLSHGKISNQDEFIKFFKENEEISACIIFSRFL